MARKRSVNTDRTHAAEERPALSRRSLLRRGVAATGMLAAVGAGSVTGSRMASAESAAGPLVVPPYMKVPGRPVSGYGQPSAYESSVQRPTLQYWRDIAGAAGNSSTPHEALEGTITPNGLHFERHHAGVPEIDPARHRLLIHGLVKRNLVFSYEDLLRYSQVSRIHFIECSGNSARNLLAQPVQATTGVLHGEISNSEWTGIPLAVLLDEAGIDPKAKWIVAEGADSAAMNRSIPLEKALGDALLALYQNGEHIRPEQGYPMRVLLPGWEGNANVKWLRRITVTDAPVQSREETSKYTDLLPDGRALQFTFEMGVKSIITRPSFGWKLTPGVYEISGIAWSGAGRIRSVEVSTDGGASWSPARMDGAALPKSVTRFRLPWRWNGSPLLLQSRASDEKGNVQPTRKALAALYAPANPYHNNAIQTWGVQADGSIRNVYA